LKIILLQDVDRLGQAGDIVQVAAGFARNYLIPQGHALVASDANVAQFDSLRRQREAGFERERRQAQELAQALEQLSLTAPVRVGEEDRLFGSVTAQHIAELLAQQGHEVDRRRIDLEEPIRELGTFAIPVRLHADVVASVKLEVVRE
jgi:large subunit ribosomal protein L9